MVAALCPWACSHEPFVARLCVNPLEASSARVDAWAWGNRHCTAAAVGASLRAPVGRITLAWGRAPEIGQKSPSGPWECS